MTVDLVGPEIEGGSPASNTGLPGATGNRRLTALPPRVDTLYLSMICHSSGRVRSAEAGLKSSVHRPPLSAEIETPRWTLKAGRPKDHVGYEFMALGRGNMAGVNVFWGPPPAEAAIPGLRRFKVAIGSEVLWRHYSHGGTAHSCAKEILDLLDLDLVERLPALRDIRVRRIDVCIDHWGYRWSGDDLKQFACRQKSRGLEERRERPVDDKSTYHGPSSATYYVGARGSAARFLRIYDKIAEAQHSGKLPWMEPAWRAAGWDGVARVWRAEIEHGGDWLTHHGLETLPKLEGCERALWRQYLSDVRHVTPSRSRRKRCPTSRVWLCLRGSIRRAEREAKRDQLRTAWTWLPREPQLHGDMETLSGMAAGCMRKIGAALFRPANDTATEIAAKRAALHAFMDQALARAEERAKRREAQAARLARPPPPRAADPAA